MIRMRVLAAASVALLAATLVVAAPAQATTFVSRGESIGTGSSLYPTQQLVSPNGRYRATLQKDGRLVVREGRTVRWFTRPQGVKARLYVHADGNVTITSGSRLLWSSDTSGAGAKAKLRMKDNGSLVVIRPKGVAWSSRFFNRCRSYTSGKKILIDISEQYMWMCDGDQQQMTSAVTTGAVDRGDGTPTGTWYVQDHQRDRYLYPASGGAYYVHYWLPYDYDYGLHDSPWQTFAYGSQQYKTQGSHGCTHVPPVVMNFTYYWAQTGTMVSIHD